MSSIRPAVLMLSLLACGMLPAHAQTIVGRVLEDGSDAPVAGAVVSLVDRGGEHRASAIADSIGRFVLAPPEAGEYVIESVRLGYETTRSPLFSMSTEGRVPFEVMMAPTPIGLDGFEVTVEREAEALLGTFGVSPARLGNRWIDRSDIEAVSVTGGAKELIRYQNIGGIWVDEFDAGDADAELCVRFQARRERQCALVIVDGIAINPGAAFHIDKSEIESIAILTPTDATTFYGTGAGGGAVLIWTRRGGGAP